MRDQPEGQLAEADLAHEVGGQVLAQQPDLVGRRRAQRRREATVGVGSGHADASSSRGRGQPAAQLVAVLVQGRRRQPVLGGRGREGDRVAHRRDGGGALPHGHHRVQPHLLGEGDALVDGVDRPARARPRR